MKYKVVQTEKGKVLVDESAEIKMGIWVVEFQNNTIIGEIHFIKSEYVIAKNIQNKITATINFSIDKDVPMVIVEDEVMKLAIKRYGNDVYSFGGQRDGFIEGFKAAQQKGVYSEEDIMKAMKYASELTNNKLKYMTDYIQSLNEEYIELEMEDYEVGEGWVGDNYNGEPITEYGTRIKTNRVDGQLIV